MAKLITTKKENIPRTDDRIFPPPHLPQAENKSFLFARSSRRPLVHLIESEIEIAVFLREGLPNRRIPVSKTTHGTRIFAVDFAKILQLPRRLLLIRLFLGRLFHFVDVRLLRVIARYCEEKNEVSFLFRSSDRRLDLSRKGTTAFFCVLRLS